MAERHDRLFRMIGGGRNLRTPLFLLVASILLLISIATEVNDIAKQNEAFDESNSALFKIIRSEIDSQVQNEQNAMAVTVSSLANIESFRSAFKAGARNQLWQLSKPLFDQANRDFGISHMYFTKPDRTVFLRVHDRDHHGDLVDRFTTVEAQRSLKKTGGLEIGKNGALTLRVVTPWYNVDGSLLGYLEIGKEIGDILGHIEKQFDVYLTEAYYKDYLNAESFLNWMVRAGQEVDWSPDGEFAFAQQPSSPFSITVIKDHLRPSKEGKVRRFDLEDVNFVSANFRLRDIQGQTVGHLLVNKDISTEMLALKNNLITHFIIVLLFLIISIVILNWFLRKVELIVTRALDGLESEVSSRTRELEHRNDALNEEIDSHQGTVAKLIAAKEEAELANKTKSEFLASMSHELRTPLNAIIGYAEFLQIENKPPMSLNQLERIDIIHDSGEHLLKLVESILDLARVEADSIQLVLENIDLWKILQDAIHQVQPMADALDIAIHFERLGKDDMTVHADEFRLKQVIINILTNGVKYNQKGGSVRIEAKHLDKNKIKVSFIDTGIGIAEDDLDRVFHLFEQGEENAYLARDGYGMGLSISKNLMEKMDGSIEVESELEKGSHFWITVPIGNKGNVIQFGERETG